MPEYVYQSTSNLFQIALVSATTGQGMSTITSGTPSLMVAAISDNGVSFAYSGGTLQAITTIGVYETPSASSCRIGPMDSVNHPGLYQLMFLDALYAITSSTALIVTVSGVTDMLQARESAAIVDPVTLADITSGVWAAATRSLTDKSDFNLAADQSAVTVGAVTTVGSVTGAVGSVTGAVGSVTGNVGGNVVGSVASVTSVGTNAISSASLQTTASEEIADALLGRDVAGGGNGTRTVTEALQRLRNRVAVAGSTGTVYAADDTATSWTFTVTTVSAVSMSDVNPA